MITFGLGSNGSYKTMDIKWTVKSNKIAFKIKKEGIKFDVVVLILCFVV